MNKHDTIKDFIHGSLQNSRFAVLATDDNGQPYASLIAITPLENYRQLVFATYRNTRKYRNLSQNNQVAVLIESERVNKKALKETVVLTIIGNTEEIVNAKNGAAYSAHQNRHPELEELLLSSDCALILIIAQSYQVVFGIDDIRWITAEDLDSVLTTTDVV
jgi:nitroimidazol reductase NimA-like FMN-containing flavoprotein (pyridoxamine 5'-phosphate oxidase superfamily)